MVPRCAVCMGVAPKTCSSCFSVSYCGSEHQKLHWKVHKRECCSCFRLEDAGELGKGLVASRDIKAGSIILEEDPAVFAACFETPSCITCGLVFTDRKRFRRCLKCRWPVCSLECEKSSVHARNECGLFYAKLFPYPPPFSYDRRKVCNLVRLVRIGFLKKKDPTRFQQIMKLDSAYSFPGFHDQEEIWLELLELVLERFGLKAKHEELVQLHRIFTINSQTAIMDYEDDQCSVSCLYLNVARINHSCVPNCNLDIWQKPSYRIRLRAATDIRRGDPLTIGYYSQEQLLGTKPRQVRILRSGFRCKCARCLDPTELGTNASAIPCASCQEKGNSPVGYLLPEDPLDLSDGAVWKCNACAERKIAIDILAPVEALWNSISEKFEKNNIRDGDSLIKACKSLVMEHSGKSLHPNHWILQHAFRALVNYFSYPVRMIKMDLAASEYFIACGLYLLAIQDVVSPGLSENRARLQLSVGMASQLRVDKWKAQKKYQRMLADSQQAEALQKEALKYYGGRPPKTDGSITPAYALTMNLERAEQDQHYLITLAICNFRKLQAQN